MISFNDTNQYNATPNPDIRGMTMTKKIKWGVLSTAKIAEEFVIPALQHKPYTEVSAIASRNVDTAKATAEKFEIPTFHGSYDALLTDPGVDAVYIPLPNHLHTEWAIKAMNAGKHVLCEKPLAMSTNDIRLMMDARDANGVKAGEAFMVNSHPQWPHLRQLIENGVLGKLTAVQGFFSYINKDPANIRNISEFGGGALWDIGCYQIHCTRYLLQQEPHKIMAMANFDPIFKTDVLTSVIMRFDDITAGFTISTQTMHSQHLTLYGEKNKLQIEIPFNAPVDRETTAIIGRESLLNRDGEILRFPLTNQYEAQGEAFSKAILNDSAVPVPLEDSLKNTAAILAAFESARTEKATSPKDFMQV